MVFVDVLLQSALSTYLLSKEVSTKCTVLISIVIAIHCQALMSNGPQINLPDPQTRVLWGPEE